MGAILDKANLVVTANGVRDGRLYALKPSNGSCDSYKSRSTPATRLNAFVGGLLESVGINVPRLDYSKGACPSILIESNATNLCLYSNEFTAVYWAKTGVSVSQSGSVKIISSENAYLLSETATTGVHQMVGISEFADTYFPHTFSCFLKKGSGTSAPDWVRLAVQDGFVNLNLVSGEVGYCTGSCYMQAYPNGWWRCSLTPPPSSVTSLTPDLKVQFTNNTDAYDLPSYTGNVNANVFISGTQFEFGSESTSYIPTTTTSIYRDVDEMIFSIPAAFYIQTIFVDFYTNDFSNDIGYLFGWYGVANLQITLISALYLVVNSFNDIDSYQFNTTLPQYGRNKIAIAINTNNLTAKIFINGAYAGALNPLVGVPNPQADIYLGQGAFNSNVNSLLTFPSTLSDAECVSLTTL